MKLSEKRFHATTRMAAFLVWAHQQGLRLVADEGRVFSPRKVWLNGKKVVLLDAVHKTDSFHHSGLAFDFVLYDAKWLPVFNGDDPRWLKLGTKWKSLGTDELPNTWGGDFDSVDSVHFSVGEV
jgi:D-alanyl-D-alanine carboxypeptidase-like protein